MNNPRNKQVVLIQLLNGEGYQARFYEQSVVVGGPGYEFNDNGAPSFCPASDVVTWLDDSANDPLGYDLSIAGGHK